MALLIYRLFFPVAFLVALPFYALRLLRRERGRASLAKPHGYHLGLGQRFARYDSALRARLADGPPPVWLCSISIGETLSALKLARAIRARRPDVRIVLSVTTSTGFELLLREAEKAPWLIPLYNPLDFRGIARSALRTIRPRELILIEGGIWPNLLAAARNLGIRTILAGARLSPRSERRWRAWPSLARPVWALFDLVCVPERDDAARFENIGVPAARIRVTGSVKFDNTDTGAPSREAEFRALVAPLGFTGPLLVAGSTWAPEEKVIASAFVELRREWPALRLIIVPRHVERADDVERELAAAGLRVARRSRLSGDEADVLLVDTTGELRDWYRLADMVFVGKSLPGIAEIGGQNIGEPAALGLPVIFGPHVENFATLAAHLLRHGAAVQISDASALTPAIRALLADPAHRAVMGAKARDSLAIHQGAAARTAELLA